MQAAAARQAWRRFSSNVAWTLVVLQLCLCIDAGTVSIREGTAEWTIQLSQGSPLTMCSHTYPKGRISFSLQLLSDCNCCSSQGQITCQLRSSITCMLLRKLLLVPSYAKADAGTADVQTLMSIGKQDGLRRCQCCVADLAPHQAVTHN
jgi:hypothetical protein